MPSAAGGAAPPPGKSWIRGRHGLVACHVFTLLALWLILRLVLFFAFRPENAPGLWDVLLTLVLGLQRDLFVALLLVLPLLAWSLALPDRWFAARWHRRLLLGGFFLFWLTQVFQVIAEYYFFEEFQSRFNTVAVDYFHYPHEVFVNIWDSYPVATVVTACAVASAAWLVCAVRFFPTKWEPVPVKTRALWFGGGVGVVVALSFTVPLKSPLFSRERTLNEMANNGVLAFSHALWTGHLDYTPFYRTMPREEAYQRARRLLAAPGVEFVGAGDNLRRHVAGDPARPRLNVVVILEESLGSEFWVSLGGTNGNWVPRMDSRAARIGCMFTNIYASGNRTIRGFEGVLSSFPPLPGDAIVRRDRSDNVETLARVLKRDGYNTLFIYGGRGVFDGMRAYALNNGYDRFIEQKDFKNPTHTTIWGVCDEDIMLRAVAECSDLAKRGPFFATVLSVSNHKPYTYPPGRIPEDPNEHRREHAVKYADYALTQFFKAAKKEPLWTNTIFVVVADHGARVYGSQSIPIHSYEIPFVIFGPAVVKEPSRVPHLGCSLDVAPTILGLIGRPYETLFFGRDLLKESPDRGRVLIHHNRDIGLFARDRLVVLGMRKDVEYYEGDPQKVDVKRMAAPGELELELEQDAIALFQVADELYSSRRYRIDP